MRLTESEANKILTELLRLRKQYKRKKTLHSKQEYQKYEAFCAAQFDYLVISKTNRYRNFANYNDLQQDGRLALILALRTFDLKKGSFFYWASQYIKTKVCREANKHSTIKIPMKKIKNFQPFKVSEMPIIIEQTESALDVLEHIELKEKINNAINQLPDLERKIIQLNGIKSYSISKISQELNLSPAHCIKLLNEAKKKLKENLTINI